MTTADPGVLYELAGDIARMRVAYEAWRECTSLHGDSEYIESVRAMQRLLDRQFTRWETVAYERENP